MLLSHRRSVTTLLRSLSTSVTSGSRETHNQQRSRRVIDDLLSLLETKRTDGVGSGDGGDGGGGGVGVGGVGGSGDVTTTTTTGGKSAANSMTPSYEDYKLWSLYPKEVKKWLLYVKSPRGHYNQHGAFFPSGKFEPHAKYLVKPVTNFHGVERILDSDLSEGYRFGIKPEEIADMSPKIKNLFSLRNASKMEVHAFRKRNNVIKWGEYIDDTGRTEVQVANLTVRIKYLGEHMASHHKDNHSNYGFNKLVHRRRSLLRYLKRQDVARYYKLIMALQLRDVA